MLFKMKSSTERQQLKKKTNKWISWSKNSRKWSTFNCKIWRRI